MVKRRDFLNRPTPISITSSRCIADCSGRDCNTASRSSAGCDATSCCGAGCGAAIRCGIGCCTTSCCTTSGYATSGCATSGGGAGCSTTNRSTAGCSTCDGLQPLSNQHFQASITSTLQSIVGLAVVAPVLGFYSGSCSRVLFWLLFWGLASYSCSYSCSCSGVLFWLLDRFARQMSSLLLEYLYDQH